MPLALTNGTALLLSPVSGGMTPVLTPYSARGVTQTLELVASGGQPWLRRDVNGTLQDVSDERFRKYRLTVTCRDGEAPCLDDAWTGSIVSVDCAGELSYPVGASPARSVVLGSTRTQGNFNYYRPSLLMMIVSIRDAAQEYAALHNWEIQLEEV